MAVCLKDSAGFTRLWPSIGMVAAGITSFALLAFSLKTLPVGTAYAVWTGIGAAGTAIFGVVMRGEPATALRLGAIALIVAGVIGLRLAGE
jgi:quaternary ammonium compound-resistance protein SugE